jgi:hypothetical protein
MPRRNDRPRIFRSRGDVPVRAQGVDDERNMEQLLDQVAQKSVAQAQDQQYVRLRVLAFQLPEHVQGADSRQRKPEIMRRFLSRDEEAVPGFLLRQVLVITSVDNDLVAPGQPGGRISHDLFYTPFDLGYRPLINIRIFIGVVTSPGAISILSRGRRSAATSGGAGLF